MADSVDEDRQRLHELGYAQELNRGMGTFSNFAISFSIISILAGAITGFWLGMASGGPIVIFFCWIVVGIFATCVGASMGEICSTYPTAGGLYYWSAKLARKNGAQWSWWTGWFNLIGQVGVIASVDYALATFALYTLNLFGSNGEPIIAPTKWALFITYLVMLGIHGLLNTFNVNLVKLFGDISVWWHVIGVVIIVGALLLFGENGQGFSHTFDYVNGAGWGFPGSTIYVVLMGMLFAQYTITGFDASAHVSEETVGAARNAPVAIIRSIYLSAIAAFVMNVVMVAAMPEDKIGEIGAQGIVAGGAVFVASIAGFLGKFLVIIATVGQFFCGLASVTANSRMIYAFSRDNGLPGSNIWHKINPKTRTPTNSLWLGVGLSAVVGLLTLVQNAAGVPGGFFALTVICAVGLYISYVIPIYLRLTNPDFKQGPWNLGTRSKMIGWISVAWVFLIGILFVLPIFKIDFTNWESFYSTMNWTGPILVVSALAIWIWWKVSANKWFTGPKVQGTAEELAAIERELGAL